MCCIGVKSIMGDMTTASVHQPRPPAGASALGSHGHQRHLLGEALRALRVFAGAAFSVVVLGESDDQH